MYGAFAEAGLSKDDVKVRFILPVDAFAAFASGSIDVWATFDPYYGIAVQRGARILRDGVRHQQWSRLHHRIGRRACRYTQTRGYCRRSARLQRAGDWALANPDAYAQIYSTLTRSPLDAAKQITQRAALKQHFVTDADIAALQKVADSADRDAILPRRIDVRAISETHIAKV